MEPRSATITEQPSVRLAAAVGAKVKDLVAWYAAIPTIMCLLDEEGNIAYTSIPDTPSRCSDIERALRAAQELNAAGLAIAHLGQAISEDHAVVEVLVVAAFADETLHVEVTPVLREDDVRFGNTRTYECDIVKVPTPQPRRHFLTDATAVLFLQTLGLLVL